MDTGGTDKYCKNEANGDEHPNENIFSTWDLYKNELNGENDPSGAKRYFMAQSHGTLNRTIQSANNENSNPAVLVDLVTPPSTPSRSEKRLKHTAPVNILSDNHNSNLKEDGNIFEIGRDLPSHPAISDLDFDDSMDIGVGRNSSSPASFGDMDFDYSMDNSQPGADDNAKTIENSGDQGAENQGAGEIPNIASHSDQECDPANLLYQSSDAYFDSADGDDVSKPWFSR